MPGSLIILSIADNRIGRAVIYSKTAMVAAFRVVDNCVKCFCAG